MIIKKTISGVDIGYDTVKGHYCSLPKDFKEESAVLEVNLEDMSASQLREYAIEKGVDLGLLTRKSDIISVIRNG